MKSFHFCFPMPHFIYKPYFQYELHFRCKMRPHKTVQGLNYLINMARKLALWKNRYSHYSQSNSRWVKEIKGKSKHKREGNAD